MTKKEYREYKANWNAALVEGRVVRFSDTLMKAYPTVGQALAAIAAADHGTIVVPTIHERVL
jgi:hypothetical protein